MVTPYVESLGPLTALSPTVNISVSSASTGILSLKNRVKGAHATGGGKVKTPSESKIRVQQTASYSFPPPVQHAKNHFLIHHDETSLKRARTSVKFTFRVEF